MKCYMCKYYECGFCSITGAYYCNGEICNNFEKQPQPTTGDMKMERNTITEMREILDAIEQGKPTQRYDEVGDEWEDFVISRPNFGLSTYRIKPESKETLLTNRELSRWLAQGNGEFLGSNGYVYAQYTYLEGTENYVLAEEIKIRKSDETEWHKPTKEYCFGEEDT